MSDIVSTSAGQFTGSQVVDNYPVPKDPMIGKMRKFREAISVDWKRSVSKPELSQRVSIPSMDADLPHTGTVTRVTDKDFRVTWDSDGRKPGQPRQRVWYPIQTFDLFMVVS